MTQKLCAIAPLREPSKLEVFACGRDARAPTTGRPRFNAHHPRPREKFFAAAQFAAAPSFSASVAKRRNPTPSLTQPSLHRAQHSRQHHRGRTITINQKYHRPIRSPHPPQKPLINPQTGIIFICQNHSTFEKKVDNAIRTRHF